MGTRTIHVKRVYEPPAASDGMRILVDRLWPRGLTKQKAKVDRWLRDIAPSNELRKWYGHDPEKWKEFKRRYAAELKESRDDVKLLLDEASQQTITLLFSSKELQFNNAVALREYLNRRK